MRDLECVVCGAELVPAGDPPHCVDCYVSEEDRAQWEDAMSEARSEHDVDDLRPVLASLRTGQISDKKAIELIDEWSRGLPFSEFAEAVESCDDGLPMTGEPRTSFVWRFNRGQDAKIEWSDISNRWMVYLKSPALFDRWFPMVDLHDNSYAEIIAKLAVLVPPGGEGEKS